MTAICAPRPTCKLTAKSGRNSQKLKIELKRSEVLLAYLEVAVRFFLTYLLIAIIAFLWDALVQPF